MSSSMRVMLMLEATQESLCIVANSNSTIADLKAKVFHALQFYSIYKDYLQFCTIHLELNINGTLYPFHENYLLSDCMEPSDVWTVRFIENQRFQNRQSIHMKSQTKSDIQNRKINSMDRTTNQASRVPPPSHRPPPGSFRPHNTQENEKEKESKSNDDGVEYIANEIKQWILSYLNANSTLHAIYNAEYDLFATKLQERFPRWKDTVGSKYSNDIGAFLIEQCALSVVRSPAGWTVQWESAKPQTKNIGKSKNKSKPPRMEPAIYAPSNEKANHIQTSTKSTVSAAVQEVPTTHKMADCTIAKPQPPPKPQTVRKVEQKETADMKGNDTKVSTIRIAPIRTDPAPVGPTKPPFKAAKNQPMNQELPTTPDSPTEDDEEEEEEAEAEAEAEAETVDHVDEANATLDSPPVPKPEPQPRPPPPPEPPQPKASQSELDDEIHDTSRGREEPLAKTKYDVPEEDVEMTNPNDTIAELLPEIVRKCYNKLMTEHNECKYVEVNELECSVKNAFRDTTPYELDVADLNYVCFKQLLMFQFKPAMNISIVNVYKHLIDTMRDPNAKGGDSTDKDKKCPEVEAYVVIEGKEDQKEETQEDDDGANKAIRDNIRYLNQCNVVKKMERRDVYYHLKVMHSQCPMTVIEKELNGHINPSAYQYGVPRQFYDSFDEIASVLKENGVNGKRILEMRWSDWEMLHELSRYDTEHQDFVEDIVMDFFFPFPSGQELVNQIAASPKYSGRETVFVNEQIRAHFTLCLDYGLFCHQYPILHGFIKKVELDDCVRLLKLHMHLSVDVVMGAYSAMHIAAWRGKFRLLANLTKYGGDPLKLNAQGETAFQAGKKHPAKVKWFFSQFPQYKQ